MDMKKVLTICMFLTSVWTVNAQTFETATNAVKNMGVGWNLGNTLDARRGPPPSSMRPAGDSLLPSQSL